MRLFLRLGVALSLVFPLVCLGFVAIAQGQSAPVAEAASAQPSSIQPSSVQSSPVQTSTVQSASSDAQGTQYITLPGPMRSFLRMAGISQKASPDEVLPLFGHFVETYGYEGSKERSPKQTEALILFKRYFVQANTLASLAGAGATLQFSTCDEARQLIADLGYKLSNGCGKDPTIEVDDSDKAFVTVDSGFPLADLQEDLRNGKPFSIPYASARVPLIYSKRDWTGKANSADIDVVTVLADQPALARLYWGLSRVDDVTRAALLRSGSVQKMLPYGSVLDFYGASIAAHGGRVIVPGGTQAEPAWAKLVGADPADPGNFAYHLIEKDDGWLAEYYDSISRAPEPQLQYFTAGDHLQRFYTAFRGGDTSSAAVRSIFRPGADLLLLVTRLPLDANGQPLVPGNLAVWRDTFRRRGATRADRSAAQRGESWKSPDDLVEALFALTRFNTFNGPVEMYATLTEIDRNRPDGSRMSADTARLLIAHYFKLRDQYQTFAEFSRLNDGAMSDFVKATEKIDAIRNPLLRADTMGIFEANIGLWEIAARQGQIPGDRLNESWRQTIEPFGAFSGSPQLFDAARASLTSLMKAATGSSDISQEQIINLLAGPPQVTRDGREVHAKLADEIRSVLADQRLVSLDTLLELGDDFAKLTQTPNKVDAARAASLAEELEEARSPRAMFTEAERAEWAPGHEPNKHVMYEMRTDLKKSVSGLEPMNEAAAERGALTPFLRDTLVGLNYAYYEPPGAEILHNSPLLVREHDFLASESEGESRAWQAPQLFGVGLTAGNGTHLSGSLAGLPYALAEIEQDFIVPDNVQALIWHDTAADLLITGVVPRWWTTSRDSLHAVALYQKAGEELVAGAAKDSGLRTGVIALLSNRLSPEAIDRVTADLNAGNAAQAMEIIAPADTFYLTVGFQKQFPGRTADWGPAGTELAALMKRDPSDTSPEAISRDFGVPHPTITQSYRDELLNLRPLPSVMDYASELLAESWESSNLYWARLADEMGYTPVMLNELAPMLTRRMVENIFGSDFDDWPALIRAMRETGDEFRSGKLAGVPKAAVAMEQP